MSILTIERKFRNLETREQQLDAKYGKSSSPNAVKKHIYFREIKEDLKRDEQVYGFPRFEARQRVESAGGNGLDREYSKDLTSPVASSRINGMMTTKRQVRAVSAKPPMGGLSLALTGGPNNFQRSYNTMKFQAAPESSSLLKSLRRYWKYTKKYAVDLDEKVRNKSALQQLPDEFLYAEEDKDTIKEFAPETPAYPPPSQSRRPFTAGPGIGTSTGTGAGAQEIERKNMTRMEASLKKSQFIPNTKNFSVAIFAGNPVRSTKKHNVLQSGFLESKQRRLFDA